jgi:hypothetical protein
MGWFWNFEECGLHAIESLGKIRRASVCKFGLNIGLKDVL